MANLGSLNFSGLAATVPGAGVGQLLGNGTQRFAVQIAYPTAGSGVLGSFILGTNVLTDATWQDVTGSVMSVGWERGSTVGQRPIAGQLTVILRNDTRTYSPGVSNYFDTGTMIRVVAGDPTLITSVQFTGVTQTWDEGFQQGKRFVTIVALEPMFMLGDVNDPAIAAIGSGENLTQRLQRLVDAASYPFSIETNRATALVGTQTFQATTLATETLTEAYLTVDSVDGVLFPTKAGKLGVCERAGFYVTTAYVLGVGGTVAIKLDELTTIADDVLLLSQVSLARSGGTELTYSQSGFAARYHASTFSRDDLITESDTDLLGVATGLLARGTQTRRPVSAMVCSDSTTSLAFLVAVDVGSVMNVKDATFVTFNNYSVCHLAHSIQPRRSTSVYWECTVGFEPTSTSTRT